MGRLTVPTSILMVLLAGLLTAGNGGKIVAQDGTPPADECAMPEGVTFDGLAFWTVAVAPADSTDLGLYRSHLEPGVSAGL